MTAFANHMIWPTPAAQPPSGPAYLRIKPPKTLADWWYIDGQSRFRPNLAPTAVNAAVWIAKNKGMEAWFSLRRLTYAQHYLQARRKRDAYRHKKLATWFAFEGKSRFRPQFGHSTAGWKL